MQGTNGVDGKRLSQDEAIELVEKLLALSKSDNEHEAANALKRALKYIEQYNLDASKLGKNGKSIDPELVEGEIPYRERWEVSLYTVVANRTFCSAVFDNHTHKISVFGRLPNVIAVQMMAEWLKQQLTRISLDAQLGRSYYELHPEYGLQKRNTSNRQFRINFLLGAIKRIGEKLDEQKKYQEVEAPNLYALTLTLKDEAKAFRNERCGPTFSSSYRANGDAGYGQGYNAADGLSYVSPDHHVPTKDSGRYLSSGR